MTDMTNTQSEISIRQIVSGATNLKGVNGAVNVFSKKNLDGISHELDIGAYSQMMLNRLNYPIMSMTVPPMTRVTIFTSNALLPSSRGQLMISNTKNSALVVSDLGMDVNSMQITEMNINPIYNTNQAGQIVAQQSMQTCQIQSPTQTSVFANVENFDNARPDPVYYTSTEMALCLIFLVLILYIVFAYNSNDNILDRRQ